MDSTDHSRRMQTHDPWWRKRWVAWTAGALTVALVVFGIVLAYVAHHIEPIIRNRVVQTVSGRFGAPVQLDELSVSAMSGLEVTGTGLRVGYPAGLMASSEDASQQSMIKAKRITFHTGLRSLLDPTTHLSLVNIEGLEIHVPPASRRAAPVLASPGKVKQPKPSLFVKNIVCTDAKLFIDTDTPGKEPLMFDLHKLVLTDVDWSRAFHYDAALTNPKPRGEIHAAGSFGPWQQQEPRQTPIDGEYSFDHADLGTIHGIGGTLSSTGHFAGLLDLITIDGATDTPNFSLDTANHPLPLHTTFHAIVDGTTGDTTLNPVQGRLLHSDITAHGSIVRVKGKGHDIVLNVDLSKARIEDMLQLAVKTEPPLMRGALGMRAKIHIPPGPLRVAEKLELAGTFDIRSVSFSNPKVQDKIDGLSLRAQGRPEDAEQAAHDRMAAVVSNMRADFSLSHAMTTVHNLNYQIPGALVLLDGVYSLDGQVFEFKGHVRTDATASQMMTGWKSLLLMPLDHFLKKQGAGMELPVQISGTQSAPHFGLALGGANDSTEKMARDVRAKAKALNNMPSRGSKPKK